MEWHHWLLQRSGFWTVRLNRDINEITISFGSSNVISQKCWWFMVSLEIFQICWTWIILLDLVGFCQQDWSWCNVGSRVFSLGFIWDGPIKHGWQRKSMIWRFHRVKDMDSVLGVLDGTKFCTNSWRKILYGSTKELITNFPCGTSSHNKKQLTKWPGFTVIEVVGQILWMNQAPKWILQPLIYRCSNTKRIWNMVWICWICLVAPQFWSIWGIVS